MASLVLYGVPCSGGALFFEHAIRITPKVEDEHFVAAVPLFDLLLHGSTQDELIEDFTSQMAFIWEAYAHAPDEVLSAGARPLKEKLNQHVQFVASKTISTIF